MANMVSNYTIINVTPTLNTNEFASGDALFNYTEIPNAVKGNKGVSKLINITVNSKKAALTAFEIMFQTNAQSLEAANAPMNITAAEGAAAGFLGWVDMPDSGQLDMGNFVIGMPHLSKPQLPFLLEAAASSTSVYFSAIVKDTVTFGASDLTFRFHIQYK